MVFFSDIFNVDATALNSYGALDISLVNDLRLFIDPFLLFGSEKSEYQKLHKEILDYVSFLRIKAKSTSKGELEAWYMFPEVKQNWLGYSKVGNEGRGLGPKFANSFRGSLEIIFSEHSEGISESKHIEKVGLFQTGVGRDNISDFTTNLILEFLLDYTQNFTLSHISPDRCRSLRIPKVKFDYRLEKWMPKTYTLPFFDGDYIILTPQDILTMDDTWINRADVNDSFQDTIATISNTQLRAEINNYFKRSLPAPKFDKKKKPKKPTKKDVNIAIAKVLEKYPVLFDYYIKLKEVRSSLARAASISNVAEVKRAIVEVVEGMLVQLKESTRYFDPEFGGNSVDATHQRILFLKQVIENNNGYRLFYYKGEPIQREADLQVIFRLTWFATNFDVNSEVDNGRGPVDYKVSKGSLDSTLVEFKLASNSKLEQNLKNQVEVYSKANSTKNTFKVILYFNSVEYKKVSNILKRIGCEQDENIILINAGRSGKESASNVR